MTLIINIILGLPLLIWGRKLFWLFVGTAGYILGFWLSQRYLNINIEWMQVLIGVALGLVGILLAIFVQKFAVTVTGFAAGVYLSLNAVSNLNIDAGPWNWFIYLIGGMIGSFLVIAIFEWALIMLTSLVGATLISQSSFEMIQFEMGPRSIIFIVLLVIGLIVQYEQKMRES